MVRCRKHGIKLRGNAEYCPACGEKTVPFFFLPFRFYINRRGCIWGSVILSFAAILLFGSS